MMKYDDEILESLIADGIIGADLESVLSNKSTKASILGTIARSAILATFKANENAKLTDVPLYVEENEALYEVKGDGTKRFIRKIDKPKLKLLKHFKLK